MGFAKSAAAESYNMYDAGGFADNALPMMSFRSAAPVMEAPVVEVFKT
jgi:hypothetical protein